MQLIFTHDVRYIIDRDAALHAVAQSLTANEDVLKRIPKILEHLYPGLDIGSIDIAISNISQLSPLSQEFRGSLLVQLQSSIEDVIEGAARVTGLEALEKNKRAISGLLVLLLIIGAFYVLTQDSTREIPPTINGDYNTIITVVSDGLERSKEEIERAIELALNDRDRRALSRDAADFAAPARGGGSVDIEGVGTLSSGSIAVVPDHEQIDALEDEEFSETRENVEIYVRALDLDQARRGWAGLINLGDEQKRVRMVIVPGIRLEVLKEEADAGPIRGDVEIFYKRGRDGEWHPYVMHLYRMRAKGEVGVGHESDESKEAT